MNITKLVLGACSTNVYIVSSNKKNAILIDPADNAAEIIKTIEENWVINSHIFTKFLLSAIQLSATFPFTPKTT